MIPKKLHYCWFGNNPKSKLFQECLTSWQEFCPDFEIIEWNEANSEKYSNAFYYNALRKKKYAFAADYVRSRVLSEQGGIYLDTDMLLLQPLDKFLQYDFFAAEEVTERIAFAVFGAIPNHRFLKQMVRFYDTTEFNIFAPPVITHTFSPLINKKTIEESEIIFDANYFYPLPYEKRLENYTKYLTQNSYAVHLWDHSWKKPDVTTLYSLFLSLKEVLVDFTFYNYSHTYFVRYTKEFLRKIYQRIFK